MDARGPTLSSLTGSEYHRSHGSGPAMSNVSSDRSVAAARTAVLDPDTTIELLRRAKAGDESAKNRLLERCLPALRRWAHGRLSPGLRGVHDTADLVQDTVVGALRRLDAFEARREGALQAYLRQALMNRIRDLARQHRSRPAAVELPLDIADAGESPLQRAIGADNLRRYEAALQLLRDVDREAIIARLELDYSYEELAVALDKPSANAARVAVCRALHRLAEAMREAGDAAQ